MTTVERTGAYSMTKSSANMKIQFITPYPDAYNPARVYQPGWVAEFTDGDGQKAIDAGAAKLAPADAFCRKYAAPELVSSECVPTGETITLAELKGDKQPVKPGLRIGRFTG